MSVQRETTARKSTGAELGFFERYLTLWVTLCIIAGIGLGHLIPQVFQNVGRMEIAQINLPVALLLWLMIVPMLLKIDLKALKNVGLYWCCIGITLFVNWYEHGEGIQNYNECCPPKQLRYV